jgi:competence protein ComGC
MSSSKVTLPPALPFLLSLVSIVFAIVFVVLTINGHYTLPLLVGFSVPAIFCATGALTLGLATLRRKPAGAPYGFAMGGSLLGGFSLVFWIVKIPLMFVILLPAMSEDAADPLVAQSSKQMRIIIRQTKSFYKDTGRMPVQLEELVQEGYIRNSKMYDPRDRLRDVPSYRLLIREMPPQEKWAETPVLEGRWPDADGNRLLGFLDEHIGTIR